MKSHAAVDVSNQKVILDATTSTIQKTSFLDLFLQAELVVQIVMIMLFLASLWSWAIIFDKLIVYGSFKRKIKKFANFFQTSKSISQLFKYTTDRKENHPLAKVLIAAVEEWQIKTKATEQHSAATIAMNTRDRVQCAMSLAISKSIVKLENNVGFLATIASSAPFIGLFGTVWGIMSSFQAIAAMKNTTLAVVAPGIAEALFATAFGLIAAIPAAIFYNKFATEIENISRQAEDFKLELYNLMLRELM